MQLLKYFIVINIEPLSQYLEVILGGILRSLTGYGPGNCVKKLCVTWSNNGSTSREDIANIPQLMSEKDWLVWKFQVQHALKAAG